MRDYIYHAVSWRTFLVVLAVLLGLRLCNEARAEDPCAVGMHLRPGDKSPCSYDAVPPSKLKELLDIQTDRDRVVGLRANDREWFDTVVAINDRALKLAEEKADAYKAAWQSEQERVRDILKHQPKASLLPEISMGTAGVVVIVVVTILLVK